MQKTKSMREVPPKFLTVADAYIIKMAPIFRGKWLEYCRHYLSEPVADYRSRLGLTVIWRPTKIEASGNEGLVLKESIEVVSILKFIVPVHI